MALWLLVSAAALAALPRGGVPAWAQACGLAAAAAALALALFAERGETGPGPASLALALVCAAAALQCVPLPAALVKLLAPITWELRSAPPARAQAWMPLTLDLPATLGSLALPLACACACAAAALLARRRETRRWLCAAPLVAGLLQAAVAFSQLEAASGMQRLAGTFINRNHQAALFGLGALIALGAALEARGRRLLWGLAAAACAAGCLLTLSRGGVLALALGAVALLALRRRREGLALTAAVAVAALLASLWLSSDALRARAEQLAPSRLPTELKLRSFLGVAAVVKDHWLTGVGRGAWQFVSERHRSVPGEMTFYYVENEPLQLAADLGVPVALLVLGLLALALARAARREGLSGLEQGALAGLVALFAQNLVDFNLELLGVALPAAIALGALQGGEAPGLRPARRAALGAPVLAALVVAAPLCAWALLAAQPQLAERDSERLLALGTAQGLELAAREAVVRHPADWLVSLAPAIGLYQRTPQPTGPALAWAGRAMLLAPRAYRPHATAAAILLRAGRPSQARVETRLALAGEGYGNVPWEVLGLATRAAHGLDELREATPEEPKARLGLVVRLYSEKRLAEARELGEAELAQSGPERAALLEELALIAVEQRDAAGALRFGDELAGLGERCTAARIRSGALAALGRAAEAEEARIAGLASCPGDRRLGEALVRARLAKGDAAGALLSLTQLDAERPGAPWAVDAHLLHAEVLEALHRPARAQAERFLAAELAPERPELALDYADRLAAAGDRAGAREALRSLASRAQGPARAALEQRLYQLEAR